MNYWLAKTEPSEYSIDNLATDTQAEWDGVTNFVAVANLKRMEAGDRVIIYHSGEKTFAGLAEVVGEGKADTNEPKSWLREFKFLKKFEAPLVTLEQIKANPNFAEWLLVRQGRLSVMEVPGNVLMWLRQDKGLDL